MAIVALTACGGGHTAAPRPKPGPVDVAGIKPHAADSAPDDTECDELIAHAIAIGMVEQRDKPPERVPSAEQQAQAKLELAAKYRPGCRAMSRRSYQCAIVASTIPALAACD